MRLRGSNAKFRLRNASGERRKALHGTRPCRAPDPREGPTDDRENIEAHRPTQVWGDRTRRSATPPRPPEWPGAASRHVPAGLNQARFLSRVPQSAQYLLVIPTPVGCVSEAASGRTWSGKELTKVSIYRQ
jgi:hypothetical protein